ncbi:MAG: DUF4339 domain-containing protein [Deltaproteobacteria bacterium]
MSWFVSQAGKTQGPLPDQRVRQLIQWGKISPAAYVCDEQLSGWVSIQRTAFASLFAPLVPPAVVADDIRPLGSLRGGPWRLSTRGAQRLGGVVTAVSMLAGALQLAAGLAMSCGP